MQYRADIDGLRALAVVPVVLYHAGFTFCRGGFVGVDIFFVISGYLITTIIHDEIRLGQFTVLGFYERRIRRIFPALFVVVFFCLLFSSGMMLPEQFEQFGQSVIAATLFVANFFFWSKSDYFTAAATTKPLLHTWSLAVEEQFYLIFPLCLLAVHQYLHGRWRPILIPAALCSLGLSIGGVYFFPSATFYLIPARAWELFLGAVLALGFFPPVQGRTMQNMLSLLGIALILFAVFFLSKQTPFPGFYAIFPCAGAALILYAGEGGDSIVGRLLSHRVPVGIGLISYSLYLWHWPLFVFFQHGSSAPISFYSSCGIVLLSFLFAILSWRYIERPFRRRGTTAQRKRLFITAIAVMTISVALGISISATGGWPARFGDKLIALHCDLKTYNIDTCFLGLNQDPAEWKGESCFLQSDKPGNTLLWGDSFAAHLVPGFKEKSTILASNVLQYTAGGCAPAMGYDPAFQVHCKVFSERIEQLLVQYGIDTVVMAAAWRLAMENGLTYEEIKQTIILLHEQGVRVVLIGQSPRFDTSVQDISNRGRLRGKDVRANRVSMDLASINAQLKKFVDRGDFVDPSTPFCNDGECRFKDEQGFYFWDDGHLTARGSSKVVEYILATAPF